MGKKLISFRMDEDRIAELRELASVYTNNNATDLLENLIRRMYFLEPLSLRGKYRTPGFGISKTEQSKFKEAWEIWIGNCCGMKKETEVKCNKKYVYTVNGEVQAFKRSELRELAKILKLPIDTSCVYTISIKKAKDQKMPRD